MSTMDQARIDAGRESSPSLAYIRFGPPVQVVPPCGSVLRIGQLVASVTEILRQTSRFQLHAQGRSSRSNQGLFAIVLAAITSENIIQAGQLRSGR